MQFNSYVFIFLFLPLAVIVYFLLSKITKKTMPSKLWMIGVSLFFYGYFHWSYLLLLIGSVIFNYFAGQVLLNGEKKKKIILFGAIAANCLCLFYFKYYNFFVTNINYLFSSNWNLKNILFPLGISFFTFQQIAFLVDSYRKDRPIYSFIDYTMFITFFPQITSGPISLHSEIIPQIQEKQNFQFNIENASKGLMMFTFGLAKKVFFADILAQMVDASFGAIDTLNTPTALLAMLSYTLQIYFDFSGYCDMALGIGMMLNIKLPFNFNSPYQALNIIDFWKRWHMTLTRFLTKYIYIPLGGNRKGIVRTYINIMLVFLISGFWHGANWTFIVWGALHGAFSVITRIFRKGFDRLHPALAWFVTFSFVNVAWVYFRAPSIQDAQTFLGKILQMNIQPINAEAIEGFKITELSAISKFLKLDGYYNSHYVFLILFFVVAFLVIFQGKNMQERLKTWKPSMKNAIGTTALLVLCILSLAKISSFLYVNF